MLQLRDAERTPKAPGSAFDAAPNTSRFSFCSAPRAEVGGRLLVEADAARGGFLSLWVRTHGAASSRPAAGLAPSPDVDRALVEVALPVPGQLGAPASGRGVPGGIRDPRYRNYASRTMCRLRPGHTVFVQSQYGMEIDMKVMLTPDEEVARVWDDYLHRFGVEEYVTARYLAPPTTTLINEDTLDQSSGPGTPSITFRPEPS